MTWQVIRLDLVSLWLNDPPAVYVSDNLSRMGELRSAPTQPLDEFEVASLKRVADGERLVTTHFTADWIRMVGAIRASRACLNCHDVERGGLLGAFSYDLRRSAE